MSWNWLNIYIIRHGQCKWKLVKEIVVTIQYYLFGQKFKVKLKKR